MYKTLSITVIIPCLNEEQGIEKVLRAMPEFVDEVIVVDNNSTDRTSDVAASLGAKVVREQVRGYGRSYKRGFAEATSDLIITLDGDHSYPVDAISYLMRYLYDHGSSGVGVVVEQQRRGPIPRRLRARRRCSRCSTRRKACRQADVQNLCGGECGRATNSS